MCVCAFLCVCMCVYVCVYWHIIALSKIYRLLTRFWTLGCQQCLGRAECAIGTDLWMWDIILPAMHISWVHILRIILIQLCSLVGANVMSKTLPVMKAKFL